MEWHQTYRLSTTTQSNKAVQYCYHGRVVSLCGSKFCSASIIEIGCLSGVTSNIQTQYDSTIIKSGTTTLTGLVVLSGTYKFAQATATEFRNLSGVTFVILYQLNGCLEDNNAITLTGNINLSILQTIN